MFDGDEHRPYVELCRKLRLQRRGVAGDWRLTHDPDEQWTEFDIRVVGSDGLNAFDSPHYDPSEYEVVWLPLLHQWLAYLAALDHRSISFDARAGKSGNPAWIWEAMTGDYINGRRGSECSSYGSTPEEAVARLWMTVTSWTRIA